MRLSEFIRRHKQQILADWESFARTLVPASQELNFEELVDHAGGMLDRIADDLERPQTPEQSSARSKGLSDAGEDEPSEAKAHGAVRAAHGFTLAQMVSEFRALRASVLRRWEDLGETDGVNSAEVMRFNEAVDQALAESICRFVEDLDHSKDLFLGILGHDLRNPLGAIMMAAGQVASTSEPESLHAKVAGRILRSSLRMKEIIGDLLDFTRSRLGTGIPIVRAPVSIERVCRDAVEEATATAPNMAVHFEAKGDLDGSWDGPRIAQALSNLLGNAVQHGARHGVITVTAVGLASEVVLAVHNWGPPIGTEDVHRIFLPLRRAESSHSAGLGLGLFIADEIVMAHGGYLAVDSSEQNGTTFTIHLPRSVTAIEQRALEHTHAEAQH